MFCFKILSKLKVACFNNSNCMKVPTMTSIIYKSINRNISSKIMEKTIQINEFTINYGVVGNGEHTVLLLPGAMGTMESDFATQLSTLDKTKYTLVSWDPIGYGKSRPPEREYFFNFYVNDASIVAQLMKRLDRDQYSVVGWSDGAITGLILAALYPDRMRRLVLMAPMAYVTEQDVKIYQGLKDISQWTPKLKQKLEAVYGAQYLERLWTSYCQYFEDILLNNDGEVCRSYLSKVSCPTLVMHGVLDPVVPVEHGRYVAKHIQGSELQLLDKGKHNFHYSFADEVNSAIDNFLSKM